MLGGRTTSIWDSKTHAKLASFAAPSYAGIYPSTDFCLTLYDNDFSVIPLSENSVLSGMKGIEFPPSSVLHQFENLVK